MYWQKFVLPKSMVVSGEAHAVLKSYGKLLEILPNVNRDKIFVGSRSSKDGSLIYYLSPEVVKHLHELLPAQNPEKCEPPKWEPDDNGSVLIRTLGNPNLLK